MNEKDMKHNVLKRDQVQQLTLTNDLNLWKSQINDHDLPVLPVRSF